MKVLTICNHGNVRSACLAREIKDLNGACTSTDLDYLENTFVKYQAVAIGAHCNKIETIKHFVEWADLVVDLSDNDSKVQLRLQDVAKEKYRRFDIGGDRWGNSFHPELREICQTIRRELLQK